MTYIPSSRDLNWTMKNMHNLQSWAVPSGGFVVLFDHNNHKFKTFTIAQPDERKTQNFTSTCTNLLNLGYTESNRVICEGVSSTDELLKDFFQYSDDEIERSKILSILTQPDDPRFSN